MFGLGFPEIIVIGIVGVAVFGSKRIPELGRSIGQTIRGFREELTTSSEEVSAEKNIKTEVKAEIDAVNKENT